MTLEADRAPGVRGLSAIDPESGDLNVIVETPKGSRNKYRYNEQLGLYELAGILPAGAVFPYDFGFLPGTCAADGDPLDVLLLMEEPAFVGCLLRCRLIGAIEAEQTERDGATMRNDRLIAVAARDPLYEEVHTLDDLSDHLVRQIEHFFASYNDIKGMRFRPIGRAGPDRTRELIQAATRQA